MTRHTDPADSRAATAEELGWLTSWCARVALLIERADQLTDTELRHQLTRHVDRARRRPSIAVEIDRKRASGFHEPAATERNAP